MFIQVASIRKTTVLDVMRRLLQASPWGRNTIKDLNTRTVTVQSEGKREGVLCIPPLYPPLDKYGKGSLPLRVATMHVLVKGLQCSKHM